MRQLVVLGTATVLLVATAACTRSDAYKREQQYYWQDSEYKNRTGSANRRAEKLGQPKKRVFVLPFVNTTPFGGEELGAFAQDELLREIRDGGRAVVPEDLRSAATSTDFYSGDKIRLGSLVREGKQLGVSILIVGRIRRITYRTQGDDVGVFRKKQSIAAADLEMRIFDVVNGKEILFDEKSADSSQSEVDLFGNGENMDPKEQRAELVRLALREGMRVFARDTARALDKISWEGRIAKISGNNVFINAGRATGLSVGDILKVMTTGEDVYDPVTGAYLGRSRGQAKGTLEIVDYLGPDGSVTVVHSGGNFSENDIVQLY